MEQHDAENAPAHTPGPWTFHPIYGLRQATLIHVPLGDGGSESNANRALISAAPDLLAACKAIVARREGRWDDPYLLAMGELRIDWPNQEYEWLRAAIAKAEGK